MGGRCIAPDRPERLSQYNPDEICRWCKNAGNFPEGGSAAEGMSTDLPERFADLFEAARTLMEQDAPGDQVFPTLAFAGCVPEWDIPDAIDLKNRLVKAWGKPEARETEVDRFVSRFPSARPVEIVDRTLILEQEPASIEIVPYPQTDIPELVEIYIYQRRRHTEPEEIARRYEQKLSSAGIACDVRGRLLPMSAEFFEGRVIITVPNHKSDVPPPYAGAVFRSERPRFQHPEAVKAYCELAIGKSGSNGFVRALNMRERKDRPGAAAKLAPTCVALILREVGRVEGRQSVHRLLNEHVYVGRFKESRIPEDGSDKNKENSLWEQINDPKLSYKVRRPLYAAQNAFLFPE